MITRFKLLIAISALGLIASCGGGGGGSSGSAPVGSYTLSKGVAQKGPLQIGSTVTVAELDDNLNPNGKIYITEVADNLGNFRLGSTIGTKLAMILAQGFFMDENTGDFTSAAITLRGISDLSVESSPSVNVLTTLQYIRLKNLVSSGKSFQDAYSQSQTEVLNAFGVDASKISNMGSLYQMKINGSSDADGVLLAISATLGKAAAMRNGSSTAAQLSDIINTIASDLSQTGRITTNSVKAELTAAQVALDIPSVRTNVQNFYAARGITITAPIFEDWISKDGTSTLPNRTQIAPTVFSFSDTNNARPNQTYTSQEITVGGLDAGTSVAVSVNTGSIIVKNSTPLSGLNTTAKNGDKLAIKTTSAAYGSSVTSSLTVGANSSSWKLNSQSPGVVNPNAFSLVAINNAIPNQSYTSSSVTVNGLNDGEVAYVTSTNGTTINLNGASTGSNSTIGQNGDVITLSASGPSYGASATYTLTVGAKTADWTLTAQTPTLVTPTSFSLTSTTDEINQLITSNTITVGGLNSGEVAQANLTLSGTMPNGASLLVNGALVTQLPTIVNQGDLIAIRTTLPGTFGATGTVTLTVGTRSANWTVSTRKPSAKYYTRFGAANSYIQDIYTSGTTYGYYAIPFMPTSSYALRYFAAGVYNGSTDSVSLYSNASGSDAPGSLLGTATLGSTFSDYSSYSYPNGPYTSTSTSTTYTDASSNVYWISSKIQGKFGSGIALTANTKYWLVIKWSNNFPHDERVDASYVNGSINYTFDFSQAKGSTDGVTWSNIQILGSGVVPAMFMTD